jgi:hypothetical protein
VITADEVDVLPFDVLGTVVDEVGSMRAALAGNGGLLGCADFGLGSLHGQVMALAVLH